MLGNGSVTNRLQYLRGYRLRYYRSVVSRVPIKHIKGDWVARVSVEDQSYSVRRVQRFGRCDCYLRIRARQIHDDRIGQGDCER